MESMFRHKTEIHFFNQQNISPMDHALATGDILNNVIDFRVGVQIIYKNYIIIIIFIIINFISLFV
jgi:hypothetical protein